MEMLPMKTVTSVGVAYWAGALMSRMSSLDRLTW